MSDGVATVHIDGAARGNPGPAAFAYVIAVPGGAPIEHSETIGRATNNVAEYTALVKALERAARSGLRQLAVHSDSELLVRQINGEYRVKNADLKEIYDDAVKLMRGFQRVTVTHVRREQNKRADELCNIALDGERPRAGPAKAAPSRPTSNAAAGLRGRVDADAVACLTAARDAWRTGVTDLAPEHVWEQLWSVLEDAAVLKSKRAKT